MKLARFVEPAKCGASMLQLLDLILHALLCSCPGPALVSTARFNFLALTVGSEYFPGMNCSVTVYSPDGGRVAVTFGIINTQLYNDCRCRAVQQRADGVPAGSSVALGARVRPHCMKCGHDGSPPCGPCLAYVLLVASSVCRCGSVRCGFRQPASNLFR